MREVDAFAHRHAEMVHELQRSGAGAAFVAVDDDKVRVDAGFEHRLADRQKLPAMADAQFEAGGLAARQAAHFGDELHHLYRCRKRLVAGRRDAILAHADAPDFRNLRRHFRRRQHAAMTRLGALADFQFNHLDLIAGRDLGELLRIEGAIVIAATKISRPDLPDQIAAIFAMIGADTALTGIVREAALLGARVQRANGIRAEGTKTHRRDIEDGRRVRLRAFGAADGDAKLLGRVRLRRDGMMHPFVAFAIDVLLGAEGPFIEHHLGALIDHRARVAAERHAVLFALEKILPHLRPDFLEQKPQMRRDRIVTQDGVIALQQIAYPEQGQPAENQDRDHDEMQDLVIGETETEQQDGDDAADRKDDEARRKRKHQGFHGSPRKLRLSKITFDHRPQTDGLRIFSYRSSIHLF